MIYQTFAQLYDELFDPQLYDDWLQFVQAHVPAGRHLLDLAGGAGRLAVLLAQAGYRVVDADFSAEMLALADQHRQAAGVDFDLVEADMRDLSGLPQYDAITCFADSLCYLPDLAAVTATFRAVYEHLVPGGYFLFDVITPYQTDEVYPGFTYNFEDPDHARAFLWASYADDAIDHGVVHDLAFFIRQGDGSYQRIGEQHFERTYQQADFRAALKAAGFADEQIQVSADFGRQKPTAQTTRWFFTVQKPGQAVKG